MKQNNLSITIVVIIAAGCIGFFGGIKYQQSKSPAIIQQFSNGTQSGRNGQFRSGQGRIGFRPVAGEIIEKDDKSITVKLQDGSSRIVLISEKTKINKVEKTTNEDLKTGSQVAIFGIDNSDGSVTAQNIQLNPQFGRMQNQQSK